jgi:hypothetical protein
MVYGMSFFMAAWRIEAESSSYDRILGNAIKIMEDKEAIHILLHLLRNCDYIKRIITFG